MSTNDQSTQKRKVGRPRKSNLVTTSPQVKRKSTETLSATGRNVTGRRLDELTQSSSSTSIEATQAATTTQVNDITISTQANEPGAMEIVQAIDNTSTDDELEKSTKKLDIPCPLKHFEYMKRLQKYRCLLCSNQGIEKVT